MMLYVPAGRTVEPAASSVDVPLTIVVYAKLPETALPLMSVAIAFSTFAVTAVPYVCMDVVGVYVSVGAALFTVSVAEPLLCAMLPNTPA